MTQLFFDGANAVMKKISINVLGKDAENTVFTLPLEGIELGRDELNALLGDRTFEAFYQQKPDGAWHPMDYWRDRKNGDFESDAVFNCEACMLEVSGGKKIEFEMVEADEDDADSEDIFAAKAHSLVFKPMPGGITLLSLHLQVRPGVGKDNLALQNHQYRPVKISLEGERKGARDGAQGNLALGNGAQASSGEEEGQRPVSGGFVQTKSAAEIDEEMRRRHPETPLMGDDEEASRTQAAAATNESGKPIDGRSERVKQEDRRRGRGTH